MSRKIKLNEENCYEYTKISYSDLVHLSGIFGLGNLSLIELDIEAYYYYTTPNIISLNVNHDGLSLVRNIDVKNKIIDNSSFVNNKDHQNGIGTSVFISQIKNAQRLGFKEITVHAIKAQINGQRDFVGYFVWAKLGYSMVEECHNNFLDFIDHSIHKGSCDNIYDLIFNTAKGCDFWFEKGYDWYGSYNLEKNAHNEYLTYAYRASVCNRISWNKKLGNELHYRNSL